MTRVTAFAAFAAIGLSAAIFAAPALAGERGASGAYFENDQWVVFKDNNECVAVAEFERGDSVYLAYNRVANAAYFSVINGNLARLRGGQEVRYDVIFINRDSNAQSEEFGNAVFYGVELSSGQRGITGLFNASEFMAGFERFHIVGVMQGDTVIGSYNLTGAPAAAAALRRCDAEVERVNPTDPATGQRRAR